MTGSRVTSRFHSKIPALIRQNATLIKQEFRRFRQRSKQILIEGGGKDLNFNAQKQIKVEKLFAWGWLGFIEENHTPS